MCRHHAWIGPPRTVASVVLEPGHGLLHQSYAPADMRGGGTVNADGFGVGWYPTSTAGSDPSSAGATGDPVRYRSARPIWSDTAFAAVAAAPCRALLGAVRSATTGMPVVETAAAPFAEGRWLFSHNGVVRGWPGSVAEVAARLPTTDLMTLDAPTDAALLWALVRDRLRDGGEPGAVLAAVVTEVAAVAPGSRLNLLLTDGATVWGTAWDHALSVRDTDTGTDVASEPVDEDPRWSAVPDRHLVVARPGTVTVVPLDAVGPPAHVPPGPDP